MSNRQIIVVPGIMGSELQYNEYKVWPPHPGVWWRGANILANKLGEINSKEVQSVGIYKSFYGELVTHLETLGGKVDIFHYDWRQNNFKHVEQLNKLIDPNVDEVIIVAHSMGGIISKLFLNSDIEDSKSSKVSKLITIGTPWNGAAEAYIALEYGIGMKFIRGIFKDIIPRFESVYQLLPNKLYVENNNTHFGNGYLNNKSWESVHKEDYLPFLKKNGLESEHVLDKFYSVISKDMPTWVEHHEIVGYSVATLTSINTEGLKVKGKYGDGDGTVPLHSAVTETKNQYFVKDKHKELPKNNYVKKILKLIINEGRVSDEIAKELNLQSIDQIKEAGFKFKVVRVACPVNVSLIDEEGDILYGDMSDIKTQNLLDIFLEGEQGVKYIDDDVYFILENNNELKKLHVEAYEEGSVSISIDEYEGDKLEKTAKFETFNMNNSNSADIVINDIIEKCQVELCDEHKTKELINSVVLKNKQIEVELSLPKTKYEFIGQNIKEISQNNYIATGNIYLEVTDVDNGTYDIMNTFYSINDGHSMVIKKDKKIKMNLKRGKNLIKIYSVDIFDNIEEINRINIHYIENPEDRIPKIKIKANPGSYVLTTEFYNSKDMDKLDILEPQCQFKFEDYSGVVGSLVKNKCITRKIKLQVNDELGMIESETFSVNEKLLNLIFESNANLKDYGKFLEEVGLDEENLKSYKATVNSKTNNYKKLNNIARLVDADSLEFRSSKFEVIIDKMKKYEVMFSNLKEYINLREQDVYEFEFSVFSNQMITHTDVKLDILIAMESDNDIREYNEIKNIEYSIVDDKYIFSLKSEEINKWLIEAEGINLDSKTLFILIRLQDERKTVLRACELNLK